MQINPQAWNTGRQYGPLGQRIAARYDAETNVIIFCDVDRCITGRIERAAEVFNPEIETLRGLVMRHYDHGAYFPHVFEPELEGWALDQKVPVIDLSPAWDAAEGHSAEEQAADDTDKDARILALRCTEEYDAPNLDVTLTVKLSQEFVSDVLITAREGGINYWARIPRVIKRQVPPKTSYAFSNDFEFVPIGFEVQDVEDPVHSETWTVTARTIQQGIYALLAGMVPVNDATRADIFRSVVNNDASDIDSVAADCIVQAGLFGELVYG